MTVASMTGFARADGHDDRYAWIWEVKSVNGRSLDVRCRLPPGMDRLEPQARAAVAERIRRGHVNLSLQLNRSHGPPKMRLNRELVEELIATARELGDVDGVAPPRLDGLLAVRGVVEQVEEEESEEAGERRAKAIAETLNTALDDLMAARHAEGERMLSVLRAVLDDIGSCVARAAASAALRPDALKARLRKQVNALLDAGTPVPEERLAQEAALLVTKLDVREEIDRLESHLTAAHELLERGGVIGRRLDFLTQEFNREANTLCSKSGDAELTQIGLQLKAAIDQLREQVQNVE